MRRLIEGLRLRLRTSDREEAAAAHIQREAGRAPQNDAVSVPRWRQRLVTCAVRLRTSAFETLQPRETKNSSEGT